MGLTPKKELLMLTNILKGAMQKMTMESSQLFAAAGNGGVWSTIHELAQYEECIQNEIFLNSETIEESRKVFKPESWNSSSEPHLGYGWFLGEKSLLGEDSHLNVDIVYHTGSQGGFRAYIHFCS